MSDELTPRPDNIDELVTLSIIQPIIFEILNRRFVYDSKKGVGRILSFTKDGFNVVYNGGTLHEYVEYRVVDGYLYFEDSTGEVEFKSNARPF